MACADGHLILSVLYWHSLQIKWHIIVSTFLNFDSSSAHTADCEQSNYERHFIIKQNKQKWHILWINTHNHTILCYEPHGKYVW